MSKANKNIQDLILYTKKVEWQKLQDLQPENLKVNYHADKTKESIIKNGFARAIYVWESPEDGKIYIVDGHLRTDILKELISDGINVPDELSCTFLDFNIIKTKKIAIRYLLEVFNTKINPTNSEVMLDWLDVEEIERDDVEIAWVNVDNLKVENSESDDINFDNIESTENREKKFKEQLITCPHCEGQFNIQV